LPHATEKNKVKREGQRKNASVIQQAIAEQAADWAQDPAVLDALPASNKAQLLMQFLPKAQPIDQDLERNLLSLNELLKDRPDLPELTRQLSVMRDAFMTYRNGHETAKRLLDDWRGTVPKFSQDEALAFLEWFNHFSEKFIEIGRQRASLDVLKITEEEAKRRLEEICNPPKKTSKTSQETSQPT
jgi:hypothetical protein